MAGRPTKYTPERVAVILGGIRAGLSREAAGARCEVSDDSIAAWEIRYPAFAEAMTVAEGDAEARFTATLAHEAGPHDVVESTRVERTV